MNDALPTLRVRGLTKRFGEVVANDAVTLEAWAGEVHCLLGENGAGKSTLIAMLAGLQQPDSGTIEFSGEVHSLGSPSMAIARGIGVVYQHSALIPSMTVLENLMLAPGGGFWLDREGAIAHLSDLSATLGTRIGPNDRVSSLSLGQQQQLDIARVMWMSPRVLVLDEPTSMLTGQGVERLMANVRELAARGVAVILVTHKLDEAIAVGDRVTVLREGRVVRRFDRGDLRIEKDRARALILDSMFGGSATALEPSPTQGRNRVAQAVHRPLATGSESLSESPERPLLRLEQLRTGVDSAMIPLAGVSLEIRSGEILGIAGIDGQGQRQLAEAISGQCALAEGRVLLDGQDITRDSVRARRLLGVRYVTDDRLGEGIVGSFSVALNLLLKRLGERPFWRFGRMRREAVREHAEQLIEAYGIRASSHDAPAGALSGGNIQKILLARELEGTPRVVVFHKPSYGLDARTVQLVHDEIRRLAAAGVAVLLISTELDELTSLAHRIAVLSGGCVAGCVDNEGDAVRERVGELMTGGAG